MGLQAGLTHSGAVGSSPDLSELVKIRASDVGDPFLKLKQRVRVLLVARLPLCTSRGLEFLAQFSSSCVLPAPSRAISLPTARLEYPEEATTLGTFRVLSLEVRGDTDNTM